MIRPWVAVGLLVTVIYAACPGGIPDSEVKAILKSHNILRSNISKGKYIATLVVDRLKNITITKNMPAARKKMPIKALKWDCGLEISAQKVASECKNAHSNAQTRGLIGENLWSFSSSAVLKIKGMGKAASDAWKHEFQEFGWPSVYYTVDMFNVGLGHATQMAWHNTTTMGCGIALCNDKHWAIVACQYNVTGNFLGAPIYYPKDSLML